MPHSPALAHFSLPHQLLPQPIILPPDDDAQQTLSLTCSVCLSSKKRRRLSSSQTVPGTPVHHGQQVFLWWLLSLGADWVPSPSCSSMVCASWGHVAVLGPLVLLSIPPVESIPCLFPAYSLTHQFKFHIGSSRGKKKDSSLPQKPSAFPAAQVSPPCLGCALASEGSLNPPCCQPAADPEPRGAPRLLQNWQPPGITSPAHVCSATPSSAVALLVQKLLLAKWLLPGILAYL